MDVENDGVTYFMMEVRHTFDSGIILLYEMTLNELNGKARLPDT